MFDEYKITSSIKKSQVFVLLFLLVIKRKNREQPLFGHVVPDYPRHVVFLTDHLEPHARRLTPYLTTHHFFLCYCG
jgi:hypothetical protein